MNKDLSVEEIAAAVRVGLTTLVSYFWEQPSRLRELMYGGFGRLQPTKEDPKIDSFKLQLRFLTLLFELRSDVVARRLQESTYTGPILTRDDFLEALPALVDTLIQDEETKQGEKASDIQRALLQSVTETHVRCMPDDLWTGIPTNHDSLREMVATTCAVASENQIPVAALPQHEKAVRELIQRLVPKDKFVARLTQLKQEAQEVFLLTMKEGIGKILQRFVDGEIEKLYG